MDKGVRKEATDKAFDAFPSHLILGLSSGAAPHASSDGDQRLARSCSAPELHLLGFIPHPLNKGRDKNPCLAPTGSSAEE